MALLSIYKKSIRSASIIMAMVQSLVLSEHIVASDTGAGKKNPIGVQGRE